MKLLILGGLGMAGHMVRNYFSEIGSFQVYYSIRPNTELSNKSNSFICSDSSNGVPLDVTNHPALVQVLKQVQPHYVINCTGILNDHARNHLQEAICVNSLLPHQLAALGKIFGFKLVHISTDCVFSGARGGYIESDIPDGISVYAKTKSLGEVLDESNLTFRTSIIGPEVKKNGIGLFNWFMQQKGTVYGFKNVFWTGVTTLELSKAIHAAIQQNLTGLYHLVPQEKICKYQLLCLIQEVFHKTDVKLIEKDNPQIDKSLRNTRYDFAYTVSNYLTMVQELYQWLDSGTNPIERRERPFHLEP